MLESIQGANHPDLARPLLNRAALHIGVKDFRAAEADVLRALTIAESRLGEQHPLMIAILVTYGTVLHRTNRTAEAKQMKRRASAILDVHPELKTGGQSVHVSDLVKTR